MYPDSAHRPIDEHVLAALLSGTLGEQEREEVLARLAADPESRMVLQMAIEALESIEAPQTASKGASEPGRRAA